MADLKIINKFPDDFTFGVATSSYQIEGNSFGKSGLSHWDNFQNKMGEFLIMNQVTLLVLMLSITRRMLN